MIYDVKTTFIDGAAPSSLAVTTGLVLGNPLDMSTLLTNMTPAPNTTPQYPFGGGLSGVAGVQPRNIGAGEKTVFLVLRVRNGNSNSVVVGATGTMSVEVVTADDTALSVNASTVLVSPTYANQTLAGGTNIFLVGFPAFQLRRYMGLKIVIGTVALTGNCILDGFLTLDPAVWQAYDIPMLT